MLSNTQTTHRTTELDEHAYHRVLKELYTSTQRRRFDRRVVEEDIDRADNASSSLLNVERTVDWKEFLSHSRFDHDAGACLYCAQSSHLEQVSASSVDVKYLPSLRQQVSYFLSEKWSHHRSMVVHILRLRCSRSTDLSCFSHYYLQP
jgi:hypothetical protein